MRGSELCFLKCRNKIFSNGNTAGALLLFFHGYDLHLISKIEVIDLPIYLLWSPQYVYITPDYLIFQRCDMLNFHNVMEDWFRGYNEKLWLIPKTFLPRLIFPGTQRQRHVIVLNIWWIWCSSSALYFKIDLFLFPTCHRPSLRTMYVC